MVRVTMKYLYGHSPSGAEPKMKRSDLRNAQTSPEFLTGATRVSEFFRLFRRIFKEISILTSKTRISFSLWATHAITSARSDPANRAAYREDL